jgi:hypothetical protein
MLLNVFPLFTIATGLPNDIAVCITFIKVARFVDFL